jgi:hypothetical protein
MQLRICLSCVISPCSNISVTPEHHQQGHGCSTSLYRCLGVVCAVRICTLQCGLLHPILSGTAGHVLAMSCQRIWTPRILLALCTNAARAVLYSYNTSLVPCRERRTRRSEIGSQISSQNQLANCRLCKVLVSTGRLTKHCPYYSASSRGNHRDEVVDTPPLPLTVRPPCSPCSMLPRAYRRRSGSSHTPSGSSTARSSSLSSLNRSVDTVSRVARECEGPRYSSGGKWQLESVKWWVARALPNHSMLETAMKGSVQARLIYSKPGLSHRPVQEPEAIVMPVLPEADEPARSSPRLIRMAHRHVVEHARNIGESGAPCSPVGRARQRR